MEDTPQLEPSPKRLRLSPGAAAKAEATQSGSIARAQAIADKFARAGGLANGISAGPPAARSGAPEPTRANGPAAEYSSLPAPAGIPGVSTAEQQAQHDTSRALELTAAEMPRRRRPSKFDLPAVDAQLPPPPQLPEQLPGPPPQSLPQVQGDISRESQESMRDKAEAIAARFAANAVHSSSPALAPTGDSSQRPAAKQPGAAGASAESEFEDDSDPFHNLPPVPPAPTLPLPQAVRSMPAQPHLASLPLPPSVAKQQPESHASQAMLPPPPQGPVSGAWGQDGSAAKQQRAPQPPRGPPPGHPQVPPPRPPPPGPRPPPGAPPMLRPPQHYPQYPPHLNVSHPFHLSFCHAGWRPQIILSLRSEHASCAWHGA